MPAVDDDNDEDPAEPEAASDAGTEAELGEGEIPQELIGTYRFEIPGDAFWIATLDADGRFVQRLNCAPA